MPQKIPDYFCPAIRVFTLFITHNDLGHSLNIVKVSFTDQCMKFNTKYYVIQNWLLQGEHGSFPRNRFFWFLPVVSSYQQLLSNASSI